MNYGVVKDLLDDIPLTLRDAVASRYRVTWACKQYPHCVSVSDRAKFTSLLTDVAAVSRVVWGVDPSRIKPRLYLGFADVSEFTEFSLTHL